jgi:hypothetical protein
LFAHSSTMRRHSRSSSSATPSSTRSGGTRGIVRVKLARDPLGERDDDVVTRTNPRKERRDVVRFPERVQRAALRPPLPPRHEVALVLSPTGAAETQ